MTRMPFLKNAGLTWFILSMFIIVGVVFGSYELIEALFFREVGFNELRWLHFSRGILTAVVLFSWVVWTLIRYREFFKQYLFEHDYQILHVLDTAQDAIIAIDHKDRIQYWNNGATRIFGWAVDEVKNKDAIQIFYQHPLFTSKNKFVQESEPFLDSLPDKNGVIKKVEISDHAITEMSSMLFKRMLIMRDVSEKLTKEIDLQRSERMASLGNMAAGIAHEIGNPLAAISSIVQLMQRRDLDERTQKGLVNIRAQIDRITNIVRELVDFSRPRSLDIEPTNLNMIVEQVIGLMKHDSRCRRVVFRTNFSSDLSQIHVVPDQIYQVILNLLINAVDACQAEKDPTIIFITYEDSENVIVSCEDNGTGIPEDVKDKIFEPFFSTKDPGKGTGLGLSVSFTIIKKFGGLIRLEEVEGNGTKFVISIPKTKEK